MPIISSEGPIWGRISFPSLRITCLICRWSTRQALVRFRQMGYLNPGALFYRLSSVLRRLHLGNCLANRTDPRSGTGCHYTAVSHALSTLHRHAGSSAGPLELSSSVARVALSSGI